MSNEVKVNSYYNTQWMPKNSAKASLKYNNILDDEKVTQQQRWPVNK